jgi:hypothetical protein
MARIVCAVAALSYLADIYRPIFVNYWSFDRCLRRSIPADVGYFRVRAWQSEGQSQRCMALYSWIRYPTRPNVLVSAAGQIRDWWSHQNLMARSPEYGWSIKLRIVLQKKWWIGSPDGGSHGSVGNFASGRLNSLVRYVISTQIDSLTHPKAARSGRKSWKSKSQIKLLKLDGIMIEVGNIQNWTWGVVHNWLLMSETLLLV